jgi:hypothetical protein
VGGTSTTLVRASDAATTPHGGLSAGIPVMTTYRQYAFCQAHFRAERHAAMIGLGITTPVTRPLVGQGGALQCWHHRLTARGGA